MLEFIQFSIHHSIYSWNIQRTLVHQLKNIYKIFPNKIINIYLQILKYNSWFNIFRLTVFVVICFSKYWQTYKHSNKNQETLKYNVKVNARCWDALGNILAFASIYTTKMCNCGKSILHQINHEIVLRN